MATVTVSCKTPNGFIMQVGNREQIIRGYNSQHDFFNPDQTTGFTTVDKDLWEAWLKINKNHPLHTSGAVFAGSSDNAALAEAKERKDVKTGMEQIDPKKTKTVKTLTNED